VSRKPVPGSRHRPIVHKVVLPRLTEIGPTPHGATEDCCTRMAVIERLRTGNRLQYMASYFVTVHSPLFSSVTVNKS
jgi:hypothetical protein